VLEAQPAKQPAVAARPANPAESMAADFAYKAEYKKAPVNDSLTWHGITLYGLVDMGVTYQNHGALNSLAGAPINYPISADSNGRYFGVGPNALSASNGIAPVAGRDRHRAVRCLWPDEAPAFEPLQVQ
jgi:hypothetical protein